MKKYLLIFLILFAGGCIRLGLYESPDLTEKGKVSTTFGSTLFYVSSEHFYAIPAPDIYFNTGVLDNTEVSIRYPVYIHTRYEGKDHYFAVLGGKVRIRPVPSLIFSFGMDLFQISEEKFNPLRVLYPGIALTDSGGNYLAGIYYTLFSNTKLLGDSSLFQVEFEDFVRFYGARKIKFRRGVDAILGGQLALPLGGKGSPVMIFELGFKKVIY